MWCLFLARCCVLYAAATATFPSHFPKCNVAAAAAAADSAAAAAATQFLQFICVKTLCVGHVFPCTC